MDPLSTLAIGLVIGIIVGVVWGVVIVKDALNIDLGRKKPYRRVRISRVTERPADRSRVPIVMVDTSDDE